MASVWVDKAGSGTASAGRRLLACVAEHGSIAHPFFRAALAAPAGAPPAAAGAGAEGPRGLADIVHFLCALHGRHPSVVDHAAARTVEPAARLWLARSAAAAAAERQYLARLAVAAGPVPGTPGSAASEAAVAGQRAALATLASSDRRGCALGAALAFAEEWRAVRALIDAAARRLDVPQPAFAFGSAEEIAAIAEAAAADAPIERAMLFGAQQLALQHRGLWDLIEARAEARAAS